MTMELIKKTLRYETVESYGIRKWGKVYKGYEESNSQEELAIFEFSSAGRAKECCDGLLKLKNYPNILRVQDVCDSYVVTDPLCTSFNRWKNQEGKVLWNFNDDGELLEMGKDLKKVCDDIIGTLCMLHKDEKYHGNLLHGVSIDDKNRVTLFNFQQHADVTVGIEKDILSLVDLVKSAAKRHPKARQSAAMELFLELRDRMPLDVKTRYLPADNLESLRHFAYYMYCNPIFWDGNMRYMFCIKVDTMRRKNQWTFDSLVFGEGRVDFDWNTKQAEIENVPFLKAVRRYMRSANIYKEREGVVSFMRNMYPHGIEHDREISFIDIENAFQRILPEAVPIVFFGVVNYLYNRPEKFDMTNTVKNLMELICQDYPTAFHL